MIANVSDCLEASSGRRVQPDPVIPEPYADHPLVRDQLFFTLPHPLLAAVVEAIGIDRFDPQLLQLEADLGRLCGDHGWQVGFWGGQPITYLLLRPKPLEISLDLSTELGWSKDAAQLEDLLTTANRRLDRFAELARGYCGWLLLHADFRREHRELFQTWVDEVHQCGIPQHELVVEKRVPMPKGWKKTRGRTTAYAEAFEQFFIRWRLAAPYLPQPLQPQLPVANLRSVLGHMRHGGSTFYLPDTFPVPSRDELRDILEDAAQRQQAPEHLQDWQRLVRASNPSKATIIGRYARLFELQHFWRVFHRRHPEALRRCTSRLEPVFASFLGTSPDSIHKDLGLLTEQLGEDWVARD